MSKPPDQVREEFVRQWLLKAEEDVGAAKSLLTYGETFLSTVCFHAQQAAEKAIKAVYLAHRMDFRYTHDLADLLNSLRCAGVGIPEHVSEAVDLAEFAWQARYPRTGEPTSESEYQRAVALAERVVQWAESVVKAKAP